MQPLESASQQVPEPTVNPLASLGPFPVEVNVAGHWVLVPARPAVDWLELLMGPVEQVDLDAIFPGLAEDPDVVEDALLTGQVSLSELADKTLDLVSTVAGRPWWVAMRMLSIVQARWPLLGTSMLLKGIDPRWVSLSAWLDVLWQVIFEHLQKDQWALVASMIEAPPPQDSREKPRDPFVDMEMTPDQFRNLLH